MVLNFEGARDQLPTVLKRCGYRYREIPQDWIRHTSVNTRFHIKIVPGGQVSIHYDVYRPDGTHYAPKETKMILKEKIRIERKIGRRHPYSRGTFRLRGEWTRKRTKPTPSDDELLGEDLDADHSLDH